MPDHEAKSISNETTFAADISDLDILRAWLLDLTAQVAARMRRRKLAGPTVQLKVRFADFKTIARAQTLPEPTSTTHEIWQAASRLLETGCQPTTCPCADRCGMSGFDGSGQAQGVLFDQEEQQKHRQLDNVVDQIKERFGGAAVQRASGLGHGD